MQSSVTKAPTTKADLIAALAWALDHVQVDLDFDAQQALAAANEMLERALLEMGIVKTEEVEPSNDIQTR